VPEPAAPPPAVIEGEAEPLPAGQVPVGSPVSDPAIPKLSL
jgi:hypothetical protein